MGWHGMRHGMALLYYPPNISLSGSCVPHSCLPITFSAGLWMRQRNRQGMVDWRTDICLHFYVSCVHTRRAHTQRQGWGGLSSWSPCPAPNSLSHFVASCHAMAWPPLLLSSHLKRREEMADRHLSCSIYIKHLPSHSFSTTSLSPFLSAVLFGAVEQTWVGKALGKTHSGKPKKKIPSPRPLWQGRRLPHTPTGTHTRLAKSSKDSDGGWA